VATEFAGYTEEGLLVCKALLNSRPACGDVRWPL